MTPAKYHEWWLFSGVVPGVPTRPANHAALRQTLSAAGVTVIVLWELLRLNADIPNEQSYITEHGIYGGRQRIADAARAASASALADYLPLFPDTDIVPETHDEVKLLLKQYAKEHAAELAADITRHGDPRSAPGFDKRQARTAMERLWGENNRRYDRADRIPFYFEPLKRLRDLLAQGISLQERGLVYHGISLAKRSREDEEVANLLLMLQHDFQRWAQEPNEPAVTAFLEKCRQLTEQYPEQLPKWPGKPPPVAPTPDVVVTQDHAILNQLAAIGPYKVRTFGPLMSIEWGPVAALDDDVAPIHLMFRYEGAFPVELLAAWGTASSRFVKALPAMKKSLLTLARRFAPNDEEDSDDLLDPVTSGTLIITASAGKCEVYCSWDVEWDLEHGFEFQIDEAGTAVYVP